MVPARYFYSNVNQIYFKGGCVSLKNIDKSVYEDVIRELYQLLSKYKTVSLVEENPELDAVLYICDEECIKELGVFQKRLEMEYGYDEAVLNKFGFHTLAKIINPDAPTHYYKLYSKETWEQVNDQEKVRQRLDGKFSKWKNTMQKKVLEKLKAKGVDDATIARVKADLQKEIADAQKELDYIKEHFDELDVRISDYENRKAYTTVTFAITPKEDELNKLISVPVSKKKPKEKFGRITLRKEIPNILWYKPKTEEEKLTELQRYLKSAKHAFGSIYYKPLSKS